MSQNCADSSALCGTAQTCQKDITKTINDDDNYLAFLLKVVAVVCSNQKANQITCVSGCKNRVITPVENGPGDVVSDTNQKRCFSPGIN